LFKRKSSNSLSYLDEIESGLKSEELAEFPIGFTGYTSLGVLLPDSFSNKLENLAEYRLAEFVLRFDHGLRIIELFAADGGKITKSKATEIMACVFSKSGFQAPAGADFEIVHREKGLEERIGTARDAILAGNVHQVLASSSISGETSISHINIYRGLRHLFPSPYLFLMQKGDLTIMGSSPGSFLRVDKSNASMSVLSGIRICIPEEVENDEYLHELRNDDVERAKHTVLVDKTTDDLALICEPDSIKTELDRVSDQFSRERHLQSVLTGRLKAEFSMTDAFSRAFPASTLTGAPKRAALNHFSENAASVSPVFGGVAGHFSSNNRMDHALAVRTIVLQKNRFSCTSGALITAESDVKEENNSINNKNDKLIQALKIAREL
jgi:anthranilate/para-aminobenzoate synthase component I